MCPNLGLHKTHVYAVGMSNLTGILRTRKPLVGLFVLIWMHFLPWIQIWQWKFELEKKKSETLSCRLHSTQWAWEGFSHPGGFKYKSLSGDVPLKWVSKSASWYNDGPLFSAKTGINMGNIFKFFLNRCENRPNFINLIPKFPKFFES